MSLIVRRYRGQGRGVYSTQPIQDGDVVEVSPVIVFEATEWRPMIDTRLESYAFTWGSDGEDRALALGFGGLFNHADVPNLSWTPSRRGAVITFRAIERIAAGVQLTIDYGWTDEEKRRWMALPLTELAR